MLRTFEYADNEEMINQAFAESNFLNELSKIKSYIEEKKQIKSIRQMFFQESDNNECLEYSVLLGIFEQLLIRNDPELLGNLFFEE